MAVNWPAQLCASFLVFLLLFDFGGSSERCVVRSKNFYGPCNSDELCTTVCHKENYPGGGYCSVKKLNDGGEAAAVCMCVVTCNTSPLREAQPSLKGKRKREEEPPPLPWGMMGN